MSGHIVLARHCRLFTRYRTRVGSYFDPGNRNVYIILKYKNFPTIILPKWVLRKRTFIATARNVLFDVHAQL